MTFTLASCTIAIIVSSAILGYQIVDVLAYIGLNLQKIVDRMEETPAAGE